MAMTKRRSKTGGAAGDGTANTDSVVEDPDIEKPASTRGPGSFVDGRAVIRKHLKTMPKRPGVYRMIDRHGDVLYVGKAKNLKNRVSSYANASNLTNRIGGTHAGLGRSDDAHGSRGSASRSESDQTLPATL